jgi:hypothetical protein
MRITRRFVLIASLVNLGGYWVYGGRVGVGPVWPFTFGNPVTPRFAPDPRKPDLAVGVEAADAETLNAEKLLRAFAEVESNNRDIPPRWDRKQQSWGYYQFGKARWSEVGGAPETWGKADKNEQDCVMLLALIRYLKNIPPDADVLTWVSRFHNTGHGMTTDSPYTLKLKAVYRRSK